MHEREIPSITVKDIAARASVSVGTVSRYLNGHQLREHHRAAIEKAIEELGYKQNYFARGLKSKRSMTIAALIYSFTDPFSSTIISEIEKLAEIDDYLVLISDYQGNPEKLITKLAYLRERFIDGLIFFPLEPSDRLTEALAGYRKDGIPVVVLNQHIPALGTDTVKVDNVSSAFRATEHLIHHGHRDLAIICGLRQDPVSVERLRGFLDAARTYSLEVPERHIVYGEYTKGGGRDRALEMFADTADQSMPRPTALLAANAEMTYGALQALRELGLEVPRDVSLIGFDHTEYLDMVDDSLTLVEQPLPKLGQVAGSLLIRRLKGDYSDFPRTVEVNTRLLVRGSVAPPSASPRAR